MKTISAVAALSLFSSALAAPLEARHDVQKPFSLEVYFSNSPLKGPIQANAGSFWINKQASTYCPDNVGSACPTGNSTSFTSSGNGNLFLNTEVPGGQQVYISPEGLLTYTVPHSGDMPSGSIDTGFEVLPSNLFSKFYDFWLCSDDASDGAYRVWLQYRDVNGITQLKGQGAQNTCTKINLMAKDTATKDPAAWEFE